MINIAYLVHSLQAGGIERSVTRIVNGLNQAMYRPVIICLDRTGPAEQWLEYKVPVIEIKKRSGNDLRAVQRLAQSLRDERIEIVQSHNWGTLLEAAMARKMSRVPIHIHAERGTVLGMVEAKGFRHWVRSKAMRLALASVDKLVSNSHAVATRVQERCGYDSRRIAIIPNGVPDYCFEQREIMRQRMRSNLGLRHDDLLLGSIGRLVEVKGFDIAVRAFADTLSAQPKAHLALIGDGPEKDRLLSMATELGVASRVHLVGRQADVTPWLAALDLYFNSSRSEGMSQSIIEAMAAGLPMIVTDVGDNSRLVRHPGMECGMTCPAENPDLLADLMTRLLSDLPRRENFSRSAIECHSEFYSERALINTVESLYQQVLDASGGDGSRMNLGSR